MAQPTNAVSIPFQPRGTIPRPRPTPEEISQAPIPIGNPGAPGSITKELEERKRRGVFAGEEIFGLLPELGQQSQDILKQRADLGQGFDAQQLGALRQTGRQQIQGQIGSAQQNLLASQGAQGVKGATASAQQSVLAQQGIQARANLENDILQKQLEAKRTGLRDADVANLQRIQSVFAEGTAAEQTATSGKGLELGIFQASQPATKVSTGPTVICTEMHRQGIICPVVFQADAAHGLKVIKESEETYIGYFVWASVVAKWMASSKLITRLVCIFSVPWAINMAYEEGYVKKGSQFGKAINFFGSKLCKLIGKLIMGLTNGKEKEKI